MKMLTGLLPPTEGTAKLFGEPVAVKKTSRCVGGSATCRRPSRSMANSPSGEISSSMQSCSIFPAAEQNKRVDEMLDRFGLREVADVEPESLPLGIRQRLQLAVAIQHRPEMLILDEPTSGVDPVPATGSGNI